MLILFEECIYLFIFQQKLIFYVKINFLITVANIRSLFNITGKYTAKVLMQETGQ
jgi:hypothetical protein